MKQIKQILEKITSLKWYCQLFIALAIIVSVFALYKLLSWIFPFILGGLLLIGVFTEGEVFSMMWNSYKQSKRVPANPLYANIYHWLTETGVNELPIATLQFTQGVEFPDITQGIFYIHLARQTVKMMSTGSVDCVVSVAKHDPFLAIKVRLISANEMLNQNQHTEEDF